MRELPRLRGLVQARLAVVLDPDPVLKPFWDDLMGLVFSWIVRLGEEWVRQLPPPGNEWWLRKGRSFLPRPGEIVVAVSALGFYGSPADRQSWIRFARTLRASGAQLRALVPCPAWRWHQEGARLWNAVDWSAPEGAGRRRRPRGLEGTPWGSAEETLLRLLAPAVRVEPGLLRRVRHLLGPGADLGTEIDVWRHPEVDGFSSRSLELPQKRRLEWMQELQSGSGNRDLLSRVAREVVDWHRDRADLVWASEVAHYLDCGVPESTFGAERVKAAEEVLLRAAATSGSRDPSQREIAGRLQAFWRREARRFLPSLVRHSRFRPAIVQAVRSYLQDDPDSVLPTGLDPEMFRTGDPEDPSRWYSLWSRGDRWFLGPAGVDGPGSWSVDIAAREPTVYVSQGLTDPQSLDLAELEEHPAPTARFVQLVTDMEEVSLERWERPEWASRAGRDRFGLWAAFEVEGIEQRLRWIPPGRFLMGSPQTEEGRIEREGPQHPVELSEGLWMAETPCTQELWEAVMGDNRSHFRSPDRPVEQVSWADCQLFLDRLNYRYRDLELDLPSEAEWEYACRAGTEGATWLGALEILGANNAPLLDEIAWYGGNSGVEFDLEDGWDSSNWPDKEHNHKVAGTRKVGQKDANPWGLYDVLGNVLEWCWDFLGDYETGLQLDPEGPEEGPDRVFRGSSWYSFARGVRAAYRSGGAPGGRSNDVGFRLSRGPRDRGAVPSSRRGAPPERGGAVLDFSVEGGGGGVSQGWVRSRRTRAWVERLGWAVEGGLDEYGRWALLEVKGVRYRLRWIYPGRFWMGSPETEAGRWEDEGPRHEVTLTEGFWLGEVPCTQALWQAVMGKNPSEFPSPNRPVENVSWEDCQQFFARLEKEVPGFGSRLPTEAQWEYACRAGTRDATWLGDLEILGERDAPLLDEISWYGGNSGVDFDLAKGRDSSGWKEKQFPHTNAGTRSVGLKPPNPWGLRDMLGNVFEWCENALGFQDPYPGGPRTDPVGTEGSFRAIRGGSWIDRARIVRAAYRVVIMPGDRNDYVGFRLSRGPQETSWAEPKEPEASRPDRRGTSRGVDSKSGAGV